jgi:hypothetical protein
MKKYFTIITLLLILVFAGETCFAQGKKKSSSKARTQMIKEAKSNKVRLAEAGKELKKSLEKELPFLEDAVKQTAEDLQRVKPLLPLGIVSQKEVSEKEAALAAARARLEAKRKEIALEETRIDTVLAEAKAVEQLFKLPPLRVGGYQATAALIRYNGASRWALADAAKVEGFFFSRFRRALPISALGQTEVHNRLGFDHRNSVDVAVHPDSAEGQAVMSYLRSAGIPFIAFRQAVAGSATGAHIHIGYPSHRIAR